MVAFLEKFWVQIAVFFAQYMHTAWMKPASQLLTTAGRLYKYKLHMCLSTLLVPTFNFSSYISKTLFQFWCILILLILTASLLKKATAEFFRAVYMKTNAGDQLSSDNTWKDQPNITGIQRKQKLCFAEIYFSFRGTTHQLQKSSP